MTAKAMLLALGLAIGPGLVAAETPDFVRLWPAEVQGLTRQSAEALPDKPLSYAAYGTEAEGAKVVARLYGWPLEDPKPVQDFDGPDMRRSVQNMAEAIEAEQGRPAAPYVVTSPQGNRLKCLHSEQQSGAALFLFCATPVKGRILEVQHVAMMRPDGTAETMQASAARFMGGLADALIAAP